MAALIFLRAFGMSIHKESLKKLEAKLKEVTSRSNALGYRQIRINFK